MKQNSLLQSLACLLMVSCSVHELDIKDSFVLEDDVFYANIERYSDPDTKVYVDKNVKILWDKDDRISIFNKITYNQEYRFAGETGDNAGAFKKIPNEDFVTGNSMDFICSVYPYQESTKISNEGVLTLTLPAEQAYREDSFGPGANTMVSATDDNMLLFKNVGGYLVLKFYGEGVTVSSVKLEGNNGELLSGKATVTPAVGDTPEIAMASTAGTSITLTCEMPVELGATKEEATQFWMVVPPTAFTKGFTLTVIDTDGDVFIKETTKSLSIARNGMLRISPIEVVPARPELIQFDDANVEQICVDNWDRDGDGHLSTAEAASVTDLGDVFKANKDICTFDELRYFTGLTAIGYSAFMECENLYAVSLPSQVNEIGDAAFSGTGIRSIVIPDSVTQIHYWAFSHCVFLESMTIPKNVAVIGNGIFAGCTRLQSITVDSENAIFESRDDSNAIVSKKDYIDPDYSEEGTTVKANTLIAGCGNTTILYGVETIRDAAFRDQTGLSDIIIPDSVVEIEAGAFMGAGMPSLQLGNSVKILGNLAFYGCNNLKEVTLPHSLVQLGAMAFSGCGSLESVKILNGLTRIEFLSFSGCPSLREVELPESTEIITFRSFADCMALESITIKATTPPVLDSAAFPSNINFDIFVPVESVEAYKAADIWSTYATFIHPIE